MSFNILENSLFGGRPAELYSFFIGAMTYRFSSSDEDVVYNGGVYKAQAITRSSMKLTQEIAKTALEIKVKANTELASLFIGSAPDQIMKVTIHGYHKGDNEYLLIWQGRVTGTVFEGLECRLTCELSTSSLKRMGLRPVVQSLCRHTLYGEQCLAVRNAHSTIAQRVEGRNVICSSSFLSGWATGGYLESSDGMTQVMIMSNSGSTLILSQAPFHLKAGQQLFVYPGCDHTLKQCRNKFNNEANFGGFYWMPKKNPFINNVMY